MFDDKIINEIKEQLCKNRQTVAVAESVTAGYLQAALASAERASFFFQGGITAYNLGQKARHLNIEPIHAEHCNCVSEQVVTEMAIHITKLFSSDWGIAISGYAAPVPECSVDEPFAFYAITFQNKLVQVKKISSQKSDAIKVQLFYVNKILSDFNQIIQRKLDQSSFSSSNDLNSIDSRFASAGPLSTSPSIE
jgi:nicotinamide-nucleotide amidase